MIAEPKCHARGCRHFLGLAGAGDEAVPVCRAYPTGIPDDIAWGDDLHLSPRPGDHGLQFEAGLVRFARFARFGLDESRRAGPIRLPSCRQRTNYSCGAAALESVARYYGIDRDEDWFVGRLGTTPEGGTRPADLVRLAGVLGLAPEVHCPASDETLRSALREGVPVVLCCQAWGEARDYGRDDSGHYAVAVGFDADRVYFEDPAVGGLDYLGWEALGGRWHDEDADGKPYVRWAMALRGPQESPPPMP